MRTGPAWPVLAVLLVATASAPMAAAAGLDANAGTVFRTIAHIHEQIVGALSVTAVAGLLGGGILAAFGDVSIRSISSVFLAIGIISGAGAFAGFFLPDVDRSVIAHVASGQEGGRAWGGDRIPWEQLMQDHMGGPATPRANTDALSAYPAWQRLIAARAGKRPEYLTDLDVDASGALFRREADQSTVMGLPIVVQDVTCYDWYDSSGTARRRECPA